MLEEAHLAHKGTSSSRLELAAGIYDQHGSMLRVKEDSVLPPGLRVGKEKKLIPDDACVRGSGGWH